MQQISDGVADLMKKLTADTPAKKNTIPLVAKETVSQKAKNVPASATCGDLSCGAMHDISQISGLGL